MCRRELPPHRSEASPGRSFPAPAASCATRNVAVTRMSCMRGPLKWVGRAVPTRGDPCHRNRSPAATTSSARSVAEGWAASGCARPGARSRGGSQAGRWRPGETSPQFARALREARSSAALNHPNVVSIFDAVEDGDRIWLVMESSRRARWLQVIEEAAPFRLTRSPASVRRRRTVWRPHTLEARCTATSSRATSWCSDDGVAKISDFGIARTIGEEQLTQTGMVSGTPCTSRPSSPAARSQLRRRTCGRSGRRCTQRSKARLRGRSRRTRSRCSCTSRTTSHLARALRDPWPTSSARCSSSTPSSACPWTWCAIVWRRSPPARRSTSPVK